MGLYDLIDISWFLVYLFDPQNSCEEFLAVLTEINSTSDSHYQIRFYDKDGLNLNLNLLKNYSNYQNPFLFFSRLKGDEIKKNNLYDKVRVLRENDQSNELKFLHEFLMNLKLRILNFKHIC